VKKQDFGKATKKSKGQSLLPEDQVWRCRECRAILGFTDREKKVLRIKYKDLYVSVLNGVVSRVCRNCGATNTIANGQPQPETPLEVL